MGALTASLVLLAGWVAIELRVTDPLIDLRAASRRAVAPFYLASLPIGAAFFGATTATTTFMAAPEHPAGYGFGLDVTALAYVGLATTTAIVLGATAVPRLVPRPRADQGRDVRGTARCQRQPVPQPHDQPQRGQRPVGHDHAGQGLPLVVPLDQLRQRHRQDPASAHGCFSRPSRHSRHCDHADCPGGRGFVPLRSGICVDSGIVVQAVSLARRATHDTLPGGRLSTRT